VSLFGMAVSAAELPAMSGAASADADGAERVRLRLDAGLRRIAFFVVPSAMAFLALGDVVAGALLQTGRFGRSDSQYVWAILAGSAVGLLAQTLGRLYSSTYYALRDTRTPLRYALVRVTLTTALGYAFAFWLPGPLGIAPRWGAAGLTASAGVAGWVEMLMLRRTMNVRIGRTGLPVSYVAKLWTSAIAGAAAGWGIKIALPALHPIVAGVVILGTYGLVYFGVAVALGISETKSALNLIRK
jgi:putative peptidoglycan lipid II flippase